MITAPISAEVDTSPSVVEFCPSIGVKVSTLPQRNWFGQIGSFSRISNTVVWVASADAKLGLDLSKSTITEPNIAIDPYYQKVLTLASSPSEVVDVVQLEVNSICLNAFILQLKGEQAKAMDFLYDEIEDRLIEEKFQFVDDFLSIVPQFAFQDSILLCMLAITLPWKSELTRRTQLLDFVQHKLAETKSADIVNQLLQGMK
jgi:hypothetical protein